MNTQQHESGRPPGAILGLLLALVLCGLACADDGEPDGHADGDGDSDSDSGDGSGEREPAYAVVTQLIAEGSDPISYVLLTDSFDEEVELDIGDAVLEIPGRAVAAGPDGGGSLYVGSDGGPTITRYDLTDGGELDNKGSVSFENQSIDAIGEYAGQLQFVSDERAYYFDNATATVVVWNPKQMVVDGAERLDALIVDGVSTVFGGMPVRHGDYLLVTAGLLKMRQEVPSLAAVVVVDTTDDSIQVVTDDRCGYTLGAVMGDDDMLYLATDAYGAATHRLNPDFAEAPCMLRFDPETASFDGDFHVDLTTLADGAAVGSLLAGPSGKAFLRVLNEQTFVIGDTPPPAIVVATAPAWRWAEIGLGDEPELMMLDDAEESGGRVLPSQLGDMVVAPLFAARERTTFVPLTGDGPGDATLSVAGLAFSSVRLR